MGGTGTDDKWWFDDLSIFDDYKDTLFVGIRQSYNLRSELGTVIDWVNSNYNFVDRKQWSFVGFSLGAYETYSTAMLHYFDVFGNYCAIGGGTVIDLKDNPHINNLQINYLYSCYGEYDIYANYCANIIADIRTKGYADYNNSVCEILPDVGHSLKEARVGFAHFMENLYCYNHRKLGLNASWWRKFIFKGDIYYGLWRKETDSKRKETRR